MKQIIFFISAFLILINTINFAQDIVWQKKMFYSYWTQGFSTKHTSDGNYIVSGRYADSGFVTKLNPSGDTLWFRILRNTELSSIIESNDGNYVVIGWSMIYKISSNGDSIWSKLITEPGGEVKIEYIAKTNDGNYILAGKYNTIPYVTNFFYLAKFDNYGNKIWSRIFGTNNQYQGLFHIKQIEGNNFIATGYVDTSNTARIVLLKLNNAGDVIWQNMYDTQYDNITYSVFQTPDYGFLTIGMLMYSNQNYRLYFTKTDSSGNHIWSKIYPGPYMYLTSSDCTVEDKFNNTYVMTGIKDTSSFLMAINSEGEKVWERSYGMDSFDVGGNSVDICYDSGYVVCGDVYYFPFNRSNPRYMYFLKTTRPEIIGISNHNNGVITQFKLYPNYPNPFNPSTTIKFELPVGNGRDSRPGGTGSSIELKIFDITGKEILSINDFKTAGVYTFTFDGNNLASGVYFYQLIAGDATYNELFTETRKMVLLK